MKEGKHTPYTCKMIYGKQAKLYLRCLRTLPEYKEDLIKEDLTGGRMEELQDKYMISHATIYKDRKKYLAERNKS